MLDMKDLEKQEIKELEALYFELSKEIYDMKTELRVVKKLDKPHLIKQKKRDRARVMTCINQFKLKKINQF